MHENVSSASSRRAILIQNMERIKVAVFCGITCAIIGSKLIVETAGFQPLHTATAKSRMLTQDLIETLNNRPTEFASMALFLSAKTAVEGRVSTLVHADLTNRDAPPSKDSTSQADNAISTTIFREHPSKKLLVTVIVVLVWFVAVTFCLIFTWLWRNSGLKEDALSCSVQLDSESDLLDTSTNSVRNKSDIEREVHLAPFTETGIFSLGPWIKRLNSLRIAKMKGTACALDFALLRVATNNFSTDNLLGRGGFGSVYKARFKEDFFTAVKQLDDNQKHVERDFQAEVELMSRVRHPNLVSLLGFSIHENQHFLVYELLQNGSLEDQLHGPSLGSELTWNRRMKIALDVARGLEHLHERCNPPVIHRDLKSSNILLDAAFNAKVSDFGLAIVCSGSAAELNVQLQGTFGYLAPEYFLDGTMSEKSDVYSYGVVLLQLITGRKAIDRRMPIGRQALVTWASSQLNDRFKLADVLDPALQKDSVDVKHLYQVAAIASLCIQSEPSYRPLITDVVNSLVPLVPIELGGALRAAARFTEQPKALSFSETQLKSFSFNDDKSIVNDRYDHLRFSMSARMADEL